MDAFRQIEPSKILNQPNAVLGVEIKDLLASIALLISLSALFQPLGCDWIALLAVGVFFAVMVPVRLSNRRKIVRDSLRYYFSTRVFYVRR